MQEDMKGEQKVNGGWGIQRDLIGGGGGGVALWTFCSSDQPLRKHSVPSGAGTGRLHLERYQVFKNKGMCFPFAADLSAEVFLLQSCKCFHPGCWEGVSNFLSSISGRFPVCRGSLIVCEKRRGKKRVCSGENEGKLCQYIRAWMWKFNAWVCCGVAPQRGDLGLQG